MIKLHENFAFTFLAKYVSILFACSVARDAPVAQGIEQWFPVPRARGSNPFRCAADSARIVNDSGGVFVIILHFEPQVVPLAHVAVDVVSEDFLRGDIFFVDLGYDFLQTLRF